MKLRRALIPPRTIQSDVGGSLPNGPFRVRVPLFGLKVIYSEGEHKLTIPLEVGLDGSFDIGTALIRTWDDSSIRFEANQVRTIERNIFAAFDKLHIRYTNRH